MAPSKAAVRWHILRRSLGISGRSANDQEYEEAVCRVSRVPRGTFGLVSCEYLDVEGNDLLCQYSFPSKDVRLNLRLAVNGEFKLDDHDFCRTQDIDNTGIVCLWPAEEVLTHYCLNHPEMFRNKRIIELGAGYGLAGLAVAACTDVCEVIVTDGNPKVVEYIEQNIKLNSEAFGESTVKASSLYWSKEAVDLPGDAFDIVIAADCTYFQDFHLHLATTIRQILETGKDAWALLFCPRRGTSLEEFIHIATSIGLDVFVDEQYDATVWKIHESFLENGDKSEWPNYDEEHNYPLLLSIKMKPCQLQVQI